MDSRIPKASSHAKPLPERRPLGSLRRRSKSVSDLRSFHSKPLPLSTRLVRPTVKPVQTAMKRSALKRLDQENKPTTAVKREALQKIDEGTKPKVQKVKIPSWDYKTRFLDLEKKYVAVQDEVKEIRPKLQSVLHVQEDNAALQKEVIELREKLQLTKELVDTLSKYKTDYLGILMKYNDTKKAYNSLLDTHKTMEKEFNELVNLKAGLELKAENLENVNLRLKQKVEEQDIIRRQLHNTVQDLRGNIRVFCRVRPPLSDENDREQCAIFCPTECKIELRKSRESVCTTGGRPVDFKQEFTFDRVFPPDARQLEVFEELAPLVQSALDGYNVCVFAYGQTGSGKTFTMQGSLQNRGMIPLTIDLIFNAIDQLKISNWTYNVSASFLEIYNETIRDLLDPSSTQSCELRYNEGRGVTVTNLRTMSIASARELRDLMDEAHKNRAVAATDFNEHSSRSHAVTKIHLEGYNKKTNMKLSGSINLVDLAGSESAKTSSSERLTETKNINKSLSTLGNVLLALYNKDNHIPYRNSKLTFLLQSCLGGNSKTLMFVNISPFEECFSESTNSLRFAAKVKEIKMTAKKNKTYQQ